MSDNIGGKIKTAAQVSCCIGIIISVLLGIVLILIDKNKVFVGILILLFGSLFSWTGSFIIYCIGKLIDAVCVIGCNTLTHQGDDDIDKYAHPNWYDAYHKSNK